MRDEDPESPTVWKDTQNERLSPRLDVRGGEDSANDKMLPSAVDTSGLPQKEQEMLPEGARPVSPSAGGGERDTAGALGDMAPEAATGLGRREERS